MSVPDASTPPSAAGSAGEEKIKGRASSLLEHLPVGVYRSTPSGRIVEANQALADLLGYDAAEALHACSIQDLYVDYDARERHLRKLHADRRTVDEYALHQTSGAVVWVRDHSRAVYGADGEVKHYDGVLVDITGERQAEAQLAASESRLRGILENATDLIAIADADGVVQYATGGARRVTGFAPEKLEGHVLFQRVHPDDQPAFRQRFQSLLGRPDESLEHECRVRHASGDWRRLSIRLHNAFDRPGIEGVLGTVRDVTEKRRFEEGLMAAKEEAEELAQLKSTFLTNMSHEIRTPLASILGFAEVLVEEVEGEKREFAELIQQGGQRLSETLDSVLDLARLEAGGFDLEAETVPLRGVMEEAAKLYAPLAEEKGLRFEMELPDRPLSLWADRAGVSRMLANLLSNAIKFTEKGSVRVEADATDARIELRVIDTGVGLDEEFEEHLFEAFRQESGGLSRLHDGAGLGLAITHRLADLMGGAIEVESEKGNGSTFVLQLPRRKKQAPSPRMPEEPLPAFEESQGQLLIVEDNHDTRRLLKHLLGARWTITLAKNPSAARQAIESQTFHAAIVDINLGAEQTGVDVMLHLREDERHAQVPVVALTAYAMPEDKGYFLEVGFDAYLAKPFTYSDLLQRLQDVTQV